MKKEAAPANKKRCAWSGTDPLCMSNDLRSRGFTFAGSTIVYAHMQAVGMVNDHLVDCFRHREVAELGRDRHDGAATV